MNYLFGHDEEVARFVAQLIPSFRGRGFGNCKAIGVIDREGLLIAGLVYHHYDPEAQVIEISAAALPGRVWMTRETLRLMFQYPFLQCGCQMVIQRIPADDYRQVRQMQAFGYDLIGVPRMLGRDKDGILALLTYEAWAANKFNRRWGHHVDQQFAEAAE